MKNHLGSLRRGTQLEVEVARRNVHVSGLQILAPCRLQSSAGTKAVQPGGELPREHRWHVLYEHNRDGQSGGRSEHVGQGLGATDGSAQDDCPHGSPGWRARGRGPDRVGAPPDRRCGFHCSRHGRTHVGVWHEGPDPGNELSCHRLQGRVRADHARRLGDEVGRARREGIERGLGVLRADRGENDDRKSITSAPQRPDRLDSVRPSVAGGRQFFISSYRSARTRAWGQ